MAGMTGRAMAKESRKITPSQRLAESLRLQKKLLKMVPNLSKVSSAEWTDEAKRAVEANKALKFSNALDPYDASIRKAFIHFKLHQAPPRNWKILLGILASAHFPTSDAERRYLSYAVKFREFFEALKDRDLAVRNTAKHFSVSTRTIETALTRTNELFGYID
jgi:hypothetical protein